MQVWIREVENGAYTSFKMEEFMCLNQKFNWLLVCL
jgi:hypothetical protein